MKYPGDTRKDGKMRALGWYCRKCNAIYFSPHDDYEHEEWHEGVNVIYWHREIEWQPEYDQTIINEIIERGHRLARGEEQ